MRTYTIFNLTTLEIYTCQASANNWLADLCDQLYILWEITPKGPSSIWGLLNGEHKIFAYHNAEFVEVWLEPNTGRVLVRDLPAGWGCK
jgi:hypothetical protein